MTTEFLLRQATDILLRTLIHVLGIVVATTIGLTVDRQDTREKPVPLAEEVGSHLIAVKEVTVVAGIVAMANVEVEHPTRVGTKLVVARVERVLKYELPAGKAMTADDDALTLDDKSIGREQLHVEQTAHVGGLEVVGTQHVGFIPERVANEVARIVGMDIDLLLHLSVLFKCLLQVIEAIGIGYGGHY